MNDTKVGQRISSNDTRTLKRTFLVGVVVINTGVFVSSIVDGSLLRHPFTQMGVCDCLGGLGTFPEKMEDIRSCGRRYGLRRSSQRSQRKGRTDYSVLKYLECERFEYV